jgi:biopolymer transport protein ExbD
MLVTEMTQENKAELELPRADQATPDEGEPGRHTINIEKDGRMKVGTRYLTLEQLDRDVLQVEGKLYRKGKSFSEKPILIRADKDARFGTVQKIMGKCLNHKIWKISFGAMASTQEKTVTVKETADESKE